jgi:hypothetical protein
MTRNEYYQTLEALASIARFHCAMTPAHLSRDCDLCQSVDDRRRELVARWGWVTDEVRR